MALEKETRRLWQGIGVGAGAALATPFLVPVLGAIARPLLKAAVAQSLVAAERGREALAHLGEVLSDVFAEVRAEAEQRTMARAAASVAAGAAASGEKSGVEGPQDQTQTRGEPN